MTKTFAVHTTREDAKVLLENKKIPEIVWHGGYYGRFCVIAYPFIDHSNNGQAFVHLKGVKKEDAESWISEVKKEHPDINLQITHWS